MSVQGQKRVIQIVDEITRCAKSFIHLKQGQKIDIWIVWLGKKASFEPNTFQERWATEALIDKSPPNFAARTTQQPFSASKVLESITAILFRIKILF